MHESRHQLWTLQEKVEVVKDDLWISEKDMIKIKSKRHVRVAEQKKLSEYK